MTDCQNQLTLRSKLTNCGFYAKISAQILSDILVPDALQRESCDRMYQDVVEHIEQECRNKIMFYVIKEALRNLGMTCTEKMLAAEVGYDCEDEFQDNIHGYFDQLNISVRSKLEPPVLAQLIELQRMQDRQACDIPFVDGEEDVDICHGIPMNRAMRPRTSMEGQMAQVPTNIDPNYVFPVYDQEELDDIHYNVLDMHGEESLYKVWPQGKYIICQGY